MDKLDLKKLHKSIYSPKLDAVEIVDVPELQFLMLDGSGDPNTPALGDAIGTLNGVAYALKFAMKAQGKDFAVMPTEGQWWVEDLSQLDFEDKSDWLWTLMILVPDTVTPDDFKQTIAELGKKKDMPRLDEVRLEKFKEGLVAQTLYIGSYEDELPTINRMHETALSQGYELRDKHHEIYLSDPRRTAPEKLKTILRQPVRKNS